MHRLHESVQGSLQVTEFDFLKQGFEFDMWANQQWLTYFDNKGFGEPDRTILGHILGGQEAWYRRCTGQPQVELVPMIATADSIQSMGQKWIALLDQKTDDPVVEFTREGELYHQKVSRIARHLIDHGTYHRGELKGLCRERGDEDFPEAGLMRYYFASGLFEHP
jgi:uncharacterized damage-inducible protein DinB